MCSKKRLHLTLLSCTTLFTHTQATEEARKIKQFRKIARMKNENGTRQQCVKKSIRGATDESASRTDWLNSVRKKTNQDAFNKSELMKSKIKMYFSMFLLIQIAKETKPNQTKPKANDGGENAAHTHHPTKSNQAAAIHNKLHTSSNVNIQRTWQRFNRCVVLKFNLLLRINLIRCAKLRAALWQHRTWDRRTCTEQKPNARNVVNDLITTTRQQWQ